MVRQAECNHADSTSVAQPKNTRFIKSYISKLRKIKQTYWNLLNDIALVIKYPKVNTQFREKLGGPHLVLIYFKIIKAFYAFIRACERYLVCEYPEHIK